MSTGAAQWRHVPIMTSLSYLMTGSSSSSWRPLSMAARERRRRRLSRACCTGLSRPDGRREGLLDAVKLAGRSSTSTAGAATVPRLWLAALRLLLLLLAELVARLLVPPDVTEALLSCAALCMPPAMAAATTLAMMLFSLPAPVAAAAIATLLLRPRAGAVAPKSLVLPALGLRSVANALALALRKAAWGLPPGQRLFARASR